MHCWKDMAKRILGGGLPVPRLIRPVIRGFYHIGVMSVEGSVFVRKVLWIEPVLRSLCSEVGRGLCADRLPYIRGRGVIKLGSRVNLSGRSCFYFMSGISERPSLVIGDDVFIGNGCTFSTAKLISLGNHCLISAGVRVHDNDGHPLDAQKRIAGERISAEDVASVIIEDNVWIGANAIILKGVHVGKNSVVGTCSVVTHDVPSDTIVAGNPAVVVKSLQT